MPLPHMIGSGRTSIYTPPTSAYTRLVQSLAPIAYWPMTENNGTVAYDASGNGRNGVYTAVTLGQPGAGDGRTSALFVPASSSRNNVYSTSLANAFPGAEGTMTCFAQCVNWTDGTQRYMIYIQADSNNKVYLSRGNTNNQIRGNYVAGGTNISFGAVPAVFNPVGFFAVGITYSKANDAAYFYVNGQRTTFTGSLGTFAGTPTSTVTCVGAQTSSGGAAFNGSIEHAAIFASPLASPDMALLHRVPGHVLYEGDSRTGWALTSYPQQAYPSITHGWWDTGSGGAQLSDMQSRAAANIAAYYRTGLAKNIVVIWGGLNDANNAVDEPTTYTRLTTLCATYRAAGFKVIVCTEIDCQSIPLIAVGWHTTFYPTLNTAIRANWTTFADGLADLGGNAALQDATNVTYYNVDLTHLTTAGYAVVAGIVATAVNLI